MDNKDQSVMNFKGVHKRFKKKFVLRGVDLEVKKGSVLGLLGKNAAGKTTMLKCGLGMLKPQSGRIEIFGEDTWTLSGSSKARLGYVPQKLELYPWMTVRQIVDYTSAFYPKWNHELSNRLIQELDLNEKDLVGKLSGGQLQSVGLVLALGHEPELVVLDEPAASLDPEARRHFLSLVLDVVKNQERTVVFSTHLTSDLERVADTVAILKGGVVDYCGGLDDLKDEVKQLKVTSSNKFLQEYVEEGMRVVDQSEGEVLLSVRGLTEERLNEFRRKWNAEIEVRDMNLEDIFIEVHRD